MFHGHLSALIALTALIVSAACGREGASPTAPADPNGSPPTTGVTPDAALFTLVTQTQPFRSYAPFPNLPTSPDGTLTASSAHQPIIRVSLNSVALGALQNGRLPSGAAFPDGSVIFKEVLGPDRIVNVYAVMYKERRNAFAANGWVWAELRPNGSVDYSVRNTGAACTGCHALDRGPQNDFVRTFERQR